MKQITLFLLSCLCSGLMSQHLPDRKRDNNWVIGSFYNSNITFDSASLQKVDSLPSNLRCLDAVASISDTSGNLLFYTNRYKIFNRDYVLMDNGDSLSCCMGVFQQGMQNGFGGPQGVLILPKPGSDSLYYVFTANLDITGSTPYFQYTSAIYYSVVDMAQAGGLGRVVQKNVPLIQDTLNIGMLNACRHANGRDWWMLIREYASNRYHRYLLSPAGVQERGVQAVGDPIPQHTFGQTLFSPDGSLFLNAQTTLDYKYIHYNLYGFDRCTGLLSDHVQGFIPDMCTFAGCAFSPSGRFMYISSADSLYQYDLQDPDWESTQQLVGYLTGWTDSVGNSYSLGIMSLAPDGKIYIICASSPYLNVINAPDSAGLACDLSPHSLALTSHNGRCMPNFPHFRLGALAGSGCDTLQQVGVPAAGGAEPIKIYPNPARDKLHIANAPPHCEALLYDLLGRERLRVAVTNDEIALSSLAEGVYVLRLENAGKVVTLRKIIIQR